MPNRAAMLGRQQTRREPIAIPEWEDPELTSGDNAAFLREPSTAEFDAYEQDVLADRKAGKRGRMRARFAIMLLEDEQGAPLFAADNVDALAAEPARILRRIFDAGIAFLEISEEDVDALGKDSAPNPDGGAS